jgi:hypothetical protein
LFVFLYLRDVIKLVQKIGIKKRIGFVHWAW